VSLDEIALAYAASIHKAQGSEFPAVVIPLTMQHYLLLERNLLYTAVTRGKKLVVVIAQAKALALAVKNQRSRKRLTRLSARLRKLMGYPLIFLPREPPWILMPRFLMPSSKNWSPF
jgi:exodeoxyribonuclease V alpha subunit